MEILEHQTLEMWNVLSFRASMTQQEMTIKLREIDSIIQKCGARTSAPAATTTYSVEQGKKNPKMDIEILMPLEQEIPAPNGFAWKPHFLLTNAVMVRHIGNPAGLEKSMNELNSYIVSHKFLPISTGYNVMVKTARTPLEIDEMEIDVYVSVSPNIL